MNSKLYIIIAITALFTACSADMTFEETYINSSTGQSRSNPFKITATDAIKGSDRFRNLIFGINTRSSNAPIVTAITTTPTRTQNGDTLFYIINYGESDGFTVVSADKRTDFLHAISDEGSLSITDTITNKGLALFFSNLNAMYCDKPVIGGGGPTLPDSTDLKPFDPIEYDNVDIRPMLQKSVREWTQTHPYNMYCPDIWDPFLQRNVDAAVGCVALSLSQICSYYEWPQKIGDFNINWDDIKYSVPTSVATLLSIIRSPEYLNLRPKYTLVLNTYTYSGHGGNPEDAIRVGRMFDYTCPSSVTGFSATEALNHLKKGRLLHIFGHPKGQGNHAWVIDGGIYQKYKIVVPEGENDVREDYFFHCCWGWGQQADGYFRFNYGHLSGSQYSREDGETPEDMTGTTMEYLWYDKPQN